MVFHHHRYAGEQLARDALTALIANLKRPSCVLVVATVKGPYGYDEVQAAPEVVLEAVAQPGNPGCQPPFVNISTVRPAASRLKRHSAVETGRCSAPAVAQSVEARPLDP